MKAKFGILLMGLLAGCCPPVSVRPAPVQVNNGVAPSRSDIYELAQNAWAAGREAGRIAEIEKQSGRVSQAAVDQHCEKVVDARGCVQFLAKAAQP